MTIRNIDGPLAMTIADRRASVSLDTVPPLYAGSGPLIVPPTRPATETVVTTPFDTTPYNNGSPNVTTNLYGQLSSIFRFDNNSRVDFGTQPAINNTASIWNAPNQPVEPNEMRFVLDFGAAVARSFINSGVIAGDAITGSMTAIYSVGPTRVTNSGYIFAGTMSEGSATGFYNMGTSDYGNTRSPWLTFLNSGTIAALATNGTATGVEILTGSRSFVNDGSILAEGAIATGLIYDTLFLSASDMTAGSVLSVVNNGLIEARSTSNLASIGMIGVSQFSQQLSITNTGTIRGDYSLVTAGANVQVLNASGGTLDGTVVMGRLDDELTNNGTIFGSVSMGLGDDLLDTVAGRIEGIVDLGMGDDLFYGSAGNDRVAGGTHHDHIEGRAGHDLLIGGAGDDTLIGGSGADGLYGELGRDRLVAEGADVASGGAGNDRIETGDLSFALIDGGEGFDTWRLPTTAKPLDLSMVANTQRVSSIEALEVAEGSGLVIRASDIAAITGASRLFVSGYGQASGQSNNGPITLVGNWTEGERISNTDGIWRTFTQGDVTVLIRDHMSVVAVAPSGPAEVVGLDTLDPGQTAPTPGATTGLYLNQPNYVSQYEPRDGERISAGEVWISPDGRSPILSEWPAEMSFGNDGIIINDGSNWGYIADRPDGSPGQPWILGVYALNAYQFDNTGTISVNAIGSQIGFGVNSSSAFIRNTGFVETYSDLGGAIGLMTYAFDSYDQVTSIVNDGIVEVYAARGHASGIFAANGGGILNTGTLIVEGARSASGLGVASYYDGGGVAEYGYIYGHVHDIIENRGSVKATTTTENGERSIGIRVDDIANLNRIKIVNSGSVDADIAVRVISRNGHASITNSGIMTGDVVFENAVSRTGYVQIGGMLNVVNSGRIDGDIIASTTVLSPIYAHTINNSGIITGDVVLSEGNDRYEATGSGRAGSVSGGLGDDTLIGGSMADRLSGGDGDDILHGGAGVANELYGGTGDDHYVVEAGDSIVENANEGSDTVEARVSSFTLRVNVENLIYGGTGDFTGIGNAADNLILGGIGNDILVGGAGADTMYGGLGNDTYYVDSAADRVFEVSGEGSDRIATTVSFTLASGQAVEALEVIDSSSAGDITLVGNAFDQRISGNAGNNYLFGDDGIDGLTGYAGDDLLNGGAGNDSLDGGDGTDTAVFSGNRSAYTISLLGGVTTIVGPDGTDQLQNIERLQFADGVFDLAGNPFGRTFNGSGANDTLNGTAGDDTLYGLDGDDVLTALDGNDILVGGAGADTMYGGLGNDTYYVDSAADRVFEVSGEGSDRIATTVSFTLASGQAVEALEVIDSSSAGDITLVGNAFDQRISGNAGNNYLFGDDGIDGLTGYAGDDLLNGGAGNDSLDGGDGTDTAVFSGNRSAYTISLLGGVTTIVGPDGTDQLQNIERLQFADGVFDLAGNPFGRTFNGSGANDTLNGTAGDDTLYGLDGDDVLTALDGNDILVGGAGADTMYGGLGNDTYYVDSAADRVFEVSGEGSDRIATTVSFTLASGQAVEALEVIDSSSAGDITLVGNAFDQRISGNAGNNYLFGDDGIDGLTGYAGDDLLNGGAGNDSLDGGDGTDTAVFSGNRSAYTISLLGGVTTIVGPDGTDQLQNIERLQFADGVFDLAGNPFASSAHEMLQLDSDPQVLPGLFDAADKTDDGVPLVQPGLFVVTDDKGGAGQPLIQPGSLDEDFLDLKVDTDSVGPQIQPGVFDDLAGVGSGGSGSETGLDFGGGFGGTGEGGFGLWGLDPDIQRALDDHNARLDHMPTTNPNTDPWG